MDVINNILGDLVPSAMAEHWAEALAQLIVGLGLSWLGATVVGKVVKERLGEGPSVLVWRLIWYPALLLLVSSSASTLGFDVSLLLGAAGVLTVGVGFAAQTSAANVISGLFLLGERPFDVGDLIKVGDTTGHVVATDLLSVKLCTFDNLLVRIPNEVLLKSQITNLTHFDVRRIDIPIRVPNHQDISAVRQTLMAVADENSRCLDEPAPVFIFRGFGQSGQNVTFCVWVATPNYLDVRSVVQAEIKVAFDAAGIEIPYDQLMIQGAGRGHSIPVVTTHSDA